MFQFVGSRQKLIIVNLYKSKLQENSYIKYKDLMGYLSKQTGIGYNTVCNTIKDYKQNKELKSPNKIKIRPTIINKIDDFNKNAIRQKIHGFWLRHEIPTLKKIVQAISDDPDLPTIPRTSLQRVLRELGFEYSKRARNSALTEREDIVVWRQKYIIDIRRYRNENRTLYYLDETWVNAGECCSKVWLDSTIKSLCNQLIVVHIGSAEGFVDGGLLCFESKKKHSRLPRRNEWGHVL